MDKDNTQPKKETSLFPGFSRMFQDKLADIQPAANADRLLGNYDFESIGIDEVQKVLPAVLFTMKNGEVEILLGDPEDIFKIAPNFVHEEMKKKMSEFFTRHKMPEPELPRHAYILQDIKGKNHVFFEEEVRREVRLVSEAVKGEEEEKEVRAWSDMMLKYKIETVTGPVYRISVEGGARQR